VPDGAGNTDPAGWVSLLGATRTVGDASLNPPLVTFTEDTGTSAHLASPAGVGGNHGPTVNFKFYLRAGSRRYLMVCPLILSSGAVINIDTQTWTISGHTMFTAVLNSMTLTNVGGLDWLLDVTMTFETVNLNYTEFAGAPNATPAYRPSYLGDGSTFLIRRADITTVVLPLSLGAGTVTKAATTGTSLTGDVAHTPQSNAVVVRYLCRNTVTQTYVAPTATFQGKPVVFPAGSQAMINGTVSRAFVGVGYVIGVTPTTAGSLVVTNARALGQLVARVDDVLGLAAGNVGAAFADSYGGTTKTSHPIAATMQAAGSLVLAAVGAVNGSADPFSLSAGWTEQAEHQSGTAATDLAAVFGTKTGGAASTVETMTATGAATTVAWGGAILELKV
jgi:hypothetical protein